MEVTAEVRDALLRIQTEYIEMPDLKLTARQAQRLWSLRHDVWEAALAALLGRHFLVRTSDGSYIRRGGRCMRDLRRLRAQTNCSGRAEAECSAQRAPAAARR
jgi:hypothetical protein